MQIAVEAQKRGFPGFYLRQDAFFKLKYFFSNQSTKPNSDEVLNCIRLKFAPGLTAPHRLKDLTDIQELIKIKYPTANVSEKLNPFVWEHFGELQKMFAEAEK